MSPAIVVNTASRLQTAAAVNGSGDRRVESFAAWRRFFEGLAELDPVVLVVEDPVDQMIQEVDQALVRPVEATGVPILVVATAAPSF